MHAACAKEIIANHKLSELLINFFFKSEWCLKSLQKLYDRKQLI